jgi:hypothetical protein
MGAVLVAAGAARAGVDVLPAAAEPVRFAADELVRYLGEITGAALRRGPAAVTVRLRLDTDADIPADLPAPKDGFDGYRIVVRDDSVDVVGVTPRGVLYAVYDLLERLGCRWYYPQLDPADREVVPRAATVELEVGTTSEASPFKYRVCHPSSMIYRLWVDWAAAHVDWAAKARYNVMLSYICGPAAYGEVGAHLVAGTPAQALEAGAENAAPALTTYADFDLATRDYETSGVAPAMRRRGLLFEAPNHCMVQLMPNDLFDEHPEWFGELDGVRHRQYPLGPEFCWSNAEAQEEFAARCVRWLRDNPHVDIFSCAPNDGGRACGCSGCARRSGTDNFALLCNVLRQRMDEAGLAHVELEVLGGYNPVTDPPETVELDPRVRVHWAHWGRPLDSPYGAPDYSMRDNLMKWVASGCPLTMVNYLTDTFASPIILPPATKVMAEDNAWLAEQGFAGVMSLMWSPESWWVHALNGWLAISWFYPDRSLDDLLDDYCEHYLGGAATPMRELHHLLADEVWFTGFCLLDRWPDLEWAWLHEVERAAPLLDRLEAHVAEAEAADVDELTAYRLSRPLAVGRLLLLLGRARLVTLPLVHEVAGGTARAGDIESALRHEVDVVQPAIAAMQAVSGMLPTETLIASRIVGSAPERMADVLAGLRTATP